MKNWVWYILALLFVVQGNAQTLNEYLKEGAENNPELKALRYIYEIAKEKPNEISGLPDTRIGAGYYISEPETRTGAQRAHFSVQQGLPWMGAVKANKEVAIAEMASEKNRLEIAKRELFLAIKKTYYEVYGLRAKLRIIASKKELLANYHETALSALENNRITAVTVLKITIAQNKLVEQEELINGVLLNTEMTLNKLLNRDGFEELIIPENLAIPEEEPTLVMDEVTYHPEVVQFDYLDVIVVKKTKANAKEGLPKLSVGLDYVLVEERPNLVFDDNGKDIIQPSVAFSIPIFSKIHSSKARQYELEREGLGYRRTQAENELSRRLETAVNNRITARISYDTQSKNLVQVKQAEEMLMIGYQSGLDSFEELLDIQEMALDFELEQIAAVKAYFIQTAIINYML